MVYLIGRSEMYACESFNYVLDIERHTQRLKH